MPPLTPDSERRMRAASHAIRALVKRGAALTYYMTVDRGPYLRRGNLASMPHGEGPTLPAERRS